MDKNQREENKIIDRCIVILTVGRSGSSLVGGILHRLGVVMSHKVDDLQQENNGDKANPKGYYEDTRLLHINRAVIAGKRANTPETFQKYIADRRKNKLWGMKDPRFATVFPSIRPLLGDYRFVVAERKKEEVIKSFHTYSRSVGDVKYIEAQQTKIENILNNDPAPRMRIQYDLLIKQPVSIIESLCDFVYEGVNSQKPGNILEAIEFVDPNLYRCKEE